MAVQRLALLVEQATRLERFFQAVQMLGGGDGDALVPAGDGLADEIGKVLDEENIILVKLDKMIVHGGIQGHFALDLRARAEVHFNCGSGAEGGRSRVLRTTPSGPNRITYSENRPRPLGIW